MKPVIIIAIAVVLLIPISAFAQEESLSEQSDRLDAENLQKAEEAGFNVDPPGSNIQQQTQEIEQQLDTDSTGFTDDQIIWGSVIISFIIIIYAVLKKKGSFSESGLLPRRGWTELQHKEVLNRQNGRCNICGQVSGTFHFDHIDDNRNNNDLFNCQALCPNCHNSKSRGLD